MRKIDLVTIVWGKKYCDYLINCALPSFLSPNNLPALNCDKRYTVYTSVEDFEYLKSFDIFKRMVSLCETRRRDSQKNIQKDYTLSFVEAYQDGTIMKFLTPDVVISDGSLMFCFNKILNGFKFVVLPNGAIRTDVDKFPSGISNDHLSLGEVFRTTVHKETQRHFTDSECFFENPVQRIDKEPGGVRVKSFYYQPIMIDCLGNSIDANCSLEGDLIPNTDCLYIVKDSSEAFELSLSKPDETDHVENRFNEDRFLKLNSHGKFQKVNQAVYDSGYKILIRGDDEH